MRLHVFLVVTILITLTSCNGQPSAKLMVDDKPNVIGDTVQELGNNIMVAYQDKNNIYWFGSWETGVYRYDGKTILHFTKKDGLSNDRIDEIKEDKSGNIYFNTSSAANTGGKINKFDGEKFTSLSVTSNPNNEWKLEPDDLWFKGSLDSGKVYRYDGTSLFPLKFPRHHLDKENERDFPKRAWGPYDVYTIYTDSKGNVWFGTAVFGACRYNGKTIDWISEEDVTEIHDGPANGVRSIIEDKDGYFWFNSKFRYKVYDKKEDNETFYSREKSIGSLDGKKDGDMHEYLSIAKDNNDELWIATYSDGVWRCDGKKITHYPVKAGTTDINVFSIYKDNYGDLWLCTHENGVYKFNGQAFERFKPNK